MTKPADNTLTTKAVAERLVTDPKTLHAFLRACGVSNFVANAD